MPPRATENTLPQTDESGRVTPVKGPIFRNVDLDIESRQSLTSIAAELGAKIDVCYCGPYLGRHLLAFEIAGLPKGPDGTIHALCSLIERLSSGGRHLWKSARRKEFDIGYDVRSSEQSLRFTIRANTLQRVSNLGATLAVTLYRDRVTTRTPRKPRRTKRRP
jgi:hypothetical protein